MGLELGLAELGEKKTGNVCIT